MFTEFLLYFFIYGFLGWVIEVIYHAIKQHQLANRGFLNGAICPIYGFGMLTLIICLEPFKDNLFLLFVGAILLCSGLELITGVVLELAFRQKWWDYSDEKFHVKGYICLKFSLIWGVAGTIAIVIIHNMVYRFVNLLPYGLIVAMVVILGVITIIDVIATIIDVAGLNKDLTHIDEIGEKIKAVSDEMTDLLYKESREAEEKYIKYRGEIENKKEELNLMRHRLENRKAEMAESLSKGQRRLLRAFPNVKSIRHYNVMEEIKLKFNDIKRTRGQ